MLVHVSYMKMNVPIETLNISFHSTQNKQQYGSTICKIMVMKFDFLKIFLKGYF